MIMIYKLEAQGENADINEISQYLARAMPVADDTHLT